MHNKYSQGSAVGRKGLWPHQGISSIVGVSTAAIYSHTANSPRLGPSVLCGCVCLITLVAWAYVGQKSQEELGHICVPSRYKQQLAGSILGTAHWITTRLGPSVFGCVCVCCMDGLDAGESF